MIEKVGGVQGITGLTGITKTTKKSLPGVRDFAKILDELQQFEQQTNSVMKEVASGNLDKLPEAITMASQLDLAVQMVIQVRNRLMEGFQEFMRIAM